MHSSDLKYLRKGQITNSSTFLQYYTAYISIVKYSELEFCWRKIDIYSFLCMFYCSHKNYFLSSKFHLFLGRSARSIWIFILLIYWSENHWCLEACCDEKLWLLRKRRSTWSLEHSNFIFISGWRML